MSNWRRRAMMYQHLLAACPECGKHELIRRPVVIPKAWKPQDRDEVKCEACDWEADNPRDWIDGGD